MDDSLKHNWKQPTPVASKIAFAEQLLQGVASSTQNLLLISDYEQSIQVSMQTLGTATEVDRVYIFCYHLHPRDKRPLVSQC